MLEMVLLTMSECPQSLLFRNSLIVNSIVYSSVISWNLETFLVWNDFLCQGIWPVYQYLGEIPGISFFLFASPPLSPHHCYHCKISSLLSNLSSHTASLLRLLTIGVALFSINCKLHFINCHTYFFLKLVCTYVIGLH